MHGEGLGLAQTRSRQKRPRGAGSLSREGRRKEGGPFHRGNLFSKHILNVCPNSVLSLLTKHFQGKCFP